MTSTTRSRKRRIVENPPYLDDEERELIESFDMENAEIPSGSEWEERKLELQQIASNTTNPPKAQISLRLAQRDLSRLKAMALQKGIPYQTLLGSIVHQYVEGRLKEG